MSECKYRLPCGWCDRQNKTCSLHVTTSNKCNHQWEPAYDLTTITNMQKYRCVLCGATKEESFVVNCDTVTLNDNSTGFPCDHHWVDVTTSNGTLHNVGCTKCGAIQAVKCVIGGGGAGDIRHG